jgi:hypothetical protein
MSAHLAHVSGSRGHIEIQRDRETKSQDEDEAKTSTHQLKSVQMILPFPSISFKAWTHVHTGSYHRDCILEPFGDEWVVHPALGNGPFALGFALLDELAEVVP